MMSGANWAQSKYHGMTREEIKAQWEANRDAAATAGTALHYDIECYYNGMDVMNDSVEYAYFLEFVSNNKDLVPYRTEWMIWDAELRFAGSIDMVFVNECDGTLLIYDWKRSKEIRKTSPWSKFSHTECVSHLPDTNFWHYSLQLNTYKALLEKNYGKTVSGMALVCLHPEQTDYKVYLADLQEEVRDLLRCKSNLKQKNERKITEWKRFKNILACSISDNYGDDELEQKMRLINYASEYHYPIFFDNHLGLLGLLSCRLLVCQPAIFF